MPAPDFRHIKTHVVRGRRFVVVWRRPRRSKQIDDCGWCEKPTKDGCRICIYPDPDPIDLLAIVLHELMHAGLYDICEGPITATENDIMRMLTRMGIKVSFHPKPKKRNVSKTKKRKKARRQSR